MHEYTVWTYLVKPNTGEMVAGSEQSHTPSFAYSDPFSARDLAETVLAHRASRSAEAVLVRAEVRGNDINDADEKTIFCLLERPGLAVAVWEHTAESSVLAAETAVRSDGTA